MKNLLTPGIVLVLGEILLCQIAIGNMENIIRKFSVNDVIYETPLSIKKIDIDGVSYNIGGVDTSDATATPDDILHGKTAYVNNEKINGVINIYNIESIDLPMYSSENIILPKGYYSKDITISPAYLSGTELSDFSPDGPFGSYKKLGHVTAASASNGNASFYGEQSTSWDGGYFSIGGICFLNKIGNGFKYADVYLSRYDDNGGVTFLSSIPSSAVSVADSTLPVHRISIPSGGGYLYLGNHSHNIGNYGYAKHGVIVSKIVLYPE